jgi:hypothetical protein
MSPCNIAAIVVGLLVLLGVAFTVPHIVKYLRLRNL